MKLRPPSSPVAQLIPALIAKRGKGGTSFRGADQYDQDKEGATLLDTNLEGLTPRERAREIAQLRAGSRVKRAVDHWSISLDPRHGKLTDDQWRQVCQDFIDDMGYRGCPFVLTRHVDEPHDHVHVTLLRIRADGTVVSDSNDFKRSHEAAARCASAIGLKPLPPRADATWAPAATDTQIGANERAKRRGTATQNHASIARTFDHIVFKSVDLAELESKLREVDVQLQIVRKSGGSVQGLNVRAVGAEEWLKASSLKSDRSLSWSKVQARLAANLELRERAQAQAERVADAARDRAQQRVGAFEQLVSCSSSIDELVAESVAAGIEVFVKYRNGSSTEIDGLKVRPVIVVEWTSASNLKADRSLSWSMVRKRLARNAELRVQAQLEEEASNAEYRRRARDREERNRQRSKFALKDAVPAGQGGINESDRTLGAGVVVDGELVHEPFQTPIEALVDEPPEDDCSSEIDPVLPDRSILRPT